MFYQCNGDTVAGDEFDSVAAINIEAEATNARNVFVGYYMEFNEMHVIDAGEYNTWLEGSSGGGLDLFSFANRSSTVRATMSISPYRFHVADQGYRMYGRTPAIEFDTTDTDHGEGATGRRMWVGQGDTDTRRFWIYDDTGGVSVVTWGSTLDRWTQHVAGGAESGHSIRLRSPIDGGISRHVKTVELDLSGATTTWTGAIPAGSMVIGVSGRVTEAITGATTFNVGVAGTADRYALNRAVTLGTTFNMANGTATAPVIYTSATDVVVTANVSDFTGGKLRLIISYDRMVPPSS